MARIVGTIAVSHAPGLTGWFDEAPADQQRTLTAGFAELGRHLRRLEPDVIIGVANDHLMNLPFHNTPDFCVGTGERWSGPTEWFKDRLHIPDFTVPGNRALGRAIVREASRAGTRLAFADRLEFTDNWAVPLHLLTPDYDVPLVPIHMNCILHPLPDASRCFALGRLIAEIVNERVEESQRVVFMATGGLSHDPGGPRYFEVDEAFDRWFLDLICSGDPERIIREATVERMRAAGEGGTTELLSWIVALGVAADRPARTLFYEPTVAYRCGTGAVIWDMM